MHLIGLTGKARSGKTTVSKMLEIYGYTALSFAAPIKAMLSVIGLDEPADKEAPLPALNLSYRQLAQTLGTEWGRTLHPDLWLILLDATLKNLPHDAKIVITDVRFENEANWIRQHGTLWHITRPNHTNNVRAHSSENGIQYQPGETFIVNDNTLNHLWVNVAAAVIRTAAANPTPGLH